MLAEVRSDTTAPYAVDLLRLAHDASADGRQRLLMGVVSLCASNPPEGALSPVLSEIFLTLARQAERDVRKLLSQQLAEAEWAPRALVNVLALDEIEIARPILSSSPVLHDDDLLRVLIEATLEHQIAVARRPQLSGRIADAIIDNGEPATLTALASNRTAEISAEGVRRLVDHSRRVAGLRGPLTRHPRLTEQLAEHMCQWVGSALRESICARFQVDESKLTPLIDHAVTRVARGESAPSAPEFDAERDEMDRRLIDKLQAAGQLRTGYLVRSVRERRIGLFAHGLAALSGFPLSRIREALNAANPEALFYACSSVGIDRAVFPALLTEIRLLAGGLPGDGGDRVWLRGSISPSSAARAFRSMGAPETV